MLSMLKLHYTSWSTQKGESNFSGTRSLVYICCQNNRLHEVHIHAGA